MSKATVRRIAELTEQIRRAFAEGKVSEALDLDVSLGILIKNGK
jgi:phage gp45-like